MGMCVTESSVTTNASSSLVWIDRSRIAIDLSPLIAWRSSGARLLQLFAPDSHLVHVRHGDSLLSSDRPQGH